MKQLFSSLNLIEVSQLKDLLENEGIPCVIKNDILSGLAGEIPFTESYPEVWVQNDADLEKAQAIKAEWRAPRESGGVTWECPNCHERLESQFTTCWKCGISRQ